ncbi:histidine kinase [Heterostelium album PN500]|uniref:Histidine kinase n=1 Tax=Heterostelium pallidum (strain ATCC 26659 / Pp 5 / PN500) TaxID=670386 RepID=D3BNE0_HETP5|nr:histidine kinase [Heterostelium album PN500]EFA76800.1 histidine kinase [Heterostelium album PN500]|eukprot:XP_020428932.1 histidine kinase [Heterostelium album PN500]
MNNQNIINSNINLDFKTSEKSSISTTPKKIIPIYKDLKDEFNLNLLERFYNELMRKNFPKEEELEPLENWIEMFQDNDENEENGADIGSVSNSSASTANEDGYKVLFYQRDNDGDEYQVDFHVVIAMCPDDKKLEIEMNGYSDIMGGVVFEYYPNGNFGCITYLLVNNEYRGQGIAGLLMKHAVSSLDNDAKSHGHLGGINAIFLETNSADKVAPEDDVMAPAQRHIIFHKLGIRLLDFDYVQPPLALEHGKCRDLLLTCVLTNNIPSDVFGSEQRYYLPSALIRKFLEVFWGSCCERLEMENWRNDIDYRRMMDQLNQSEKIPLMDLPWSRPWTIIDLHSTPNPICEQLATRFYHEVLVPNFSGENELDSLESWISMLPGNGGSNNNGNNNNSNSSSGGVTKQDFHLLVSLRYLDDDITQQPMICGGLVFEYHSDVNCGLLSYILVGDEHMARSLIQRAVDILDRNAVERGNLAGCNAIFLETAHFSNNSTTTSTTTTTKNNTDNRIMETSYCHEFLDRMGWRKVDFSYVQPPLSVDKKPSGKLSLAVLVTKRIPQSRPDCHYLPASLLLEFTTNYWRFNCSANGYAMDDDVDYQHMIENLSRREKIPLLHIPWSRPFTFIDLSTDYHEDLLQEYCNLSQQQQQQQSQDYFSHWKYQLVRGRSAMSLEDFHLVLATSYNQETRKSEIVGGVSFSYLHNGNCGVIHNLYTKESIDNNNNDSNNDINNNNQSISQYKGWDIAKELLEQAVDTLNRNSHSRTHIIGPNAIFFEVPNKVNNNIDINNSINNNNNSNSLKPIYYTSILEKQGWFKLDIINYISPMKTSAVATNNNNNNNININNNNSNNTSLLSWTLCILKTPKLPSDSSTTLSGREEQQQQQQYIPIDILKIFLGQYWASYLLISEQKQQQQQQQRQQNEHQQLRKSTRKLSNSKRQIIIKDLNFRSMIDSFKSKERIYLLSNK